MASMTALISPVTRSCEPILVTGAQRSGTTWIGRMLEASGAVVYINEPLNPLTPNVLVPLRVTGQYSYICGENEEAFLRSFQHLLALHYPTRDEIGAIRSPADVLRMGRRFTAFMRARREDRRPLLKDPFAVFSAPWFARRLGCRVVITVRHPVAVVSSFLRLGWCVDFEAMTKQPLLMRDVLGAFQPEMERMSERADILGQACLLWNMVYSVVHRYSRELSDVVLVRHEDLSGDSVAGYRHLYAALGLEFSEAAAAKIRGASSDANPTELDVDRPHSVSIDSLANLQNWRHRVKPADVIRIRELTERTAASFYEASSWPSSPLR
jgi:Sulfotransferase family